MHPFALIARYVVVLDDEREFKFKPENLTLGIRTRSGTDVRKLRFGSTFRTGALPEIHARISS